MIASTAPTFKKKKNSKSVVFVETSSIGFIPTCPTGATRVSVPDMAQNGTICHSKSNRREILFGVPQGPILFLVYIEIHITTSPDAELILHANDDFIILKVPFRSY